MANDTNNRGSGAETQLLLSNEDSSLQSTGGSDISKLRTTIRFFLSSKYGHLFVMILVTLDVAGIFADFLISLHICEHSNQDMSGWTAIKEGLDVFSLVISCIFMVELLCSIFAFGFGYFKSKFHCFDATAILASFLVDALTRGPVEEAGSLIIILRLFRVFKIVEESGTVATEQLESYEGKIKDLEEENVQLRKRLNASQP